jgi:hypothetical protein
MNALFGDLWSAVSALIVAALTLVLSLFSTGCAPNATELERGFTFVGERILVPIANKALTETITRSSYLGGGVQGIEPGYCVEIEGKLVQGFEGKAEIRACGISGQLTGHVQSDAGQEAPQLTTAQPPGEETTAAPPATTEEISGPAPPTSQPATPGVT